MRQLAEGGHIRQQTYDAGTQSNVRTPGTGQIVPVCLPLLSDTNQFLWVYSNQIELPADSVAELLKAFDQFPYLTQEQSIELARRCSLLQDQVKAWFIEKRIQFGISWDYEDICDVRDKYRSKKKGDVENREGPNETDEDVRESKRKKKNPKDKEGGSDEESGGEERNPKEGTTKAQEESANENPGRKNKETQTAKSVKLIRAEDDASSQKKRKLESKEDKGRKKWVKRDNEGDREVEMMDKSENKDRAITESEGAGLRKSAVKKQTKTVGENPSEPDVPPSKVSFLKPPAQTVSSVPLTETQADPRHSADAPSTPTDVSFQGKLQAWAGLREDLLREASVSDVFVTDVGKLKELTSVTGPSPADHPPAPIKQDADIPVAPAPNRKTPSQLEMIKFAFLNCQYPDSNQYTWLSELTKIPRTVVVQWYGDMRYAVKRAKPRWMTEEQYKLTLGNIEYHQYINKLKKSSYGSDNKASVKGIQPCEGSKEKEKKEASEVKFGWINT